MKEAFDCMPKEQFEFISKIQADMLESTNMTKGEAWDFGFRCWQCGYAKVEKQNIVSEVEAECLKNPVYQYAMVYANNLVQFGVDVREHMDSAVAQSMALNQAYIKGVEDERKRTYETEYGNGWIPVESGKMPKEDERVLCLHDDGFIDCGELVGKTWCCDMDEYAVNRDNVLAWMPLPEPYKPEKGEKA